MSVLVASPPICQDLPGERTRIRFPLRLGDQDRSVVVEVPLRVSVEATSAIVPTAMLIAMREGVPLVVEGTVSARLASNLGKAQAILRAWRPALTVVPVDVSASADEGPPGPETGGFFTAGIDSFYSAIKHEGAFDRLVYVNGFEIFPDPTVAADVLGAIRRSAEGLGVPLSIVETDLRRRIDPSIDWFWSHGAGLAAIAIVLGGVLGRMHIASTSSYARLSPCGTHPLLDPLWSTEQVELVHDGCEATRVEKAQRIGRHPAVRDGLRTCWEFRTADVNCGRCGKCLHTMTAFHVVGMLEGIRTFPRPLTASSVALMPSADNLFRAGYVDEYLEFARRSGRPLRLRIALRIASIRLHAAAPLRRAVAGYPRIERILGSLFRTGARLVRRR